MDEHEIIQRCIAGQDKGWKEFLACYGGSIYGAITYVLRRFSIHEPEAAEDVFAQVVEKLLVEDCKALRDFQWNSKLTTWLISIARNKTYDYLRGRKRKPEIPLSSLVDEDGHLIEEVLASELDLDHQMEVQLTLTEALSWLPAKAKLILQLHYIEGMKEREIAELLNLSVDAVSARKSRALQKLRKLVRKRH